MIQVRKRDGKVVPFDLEKIFNNMSNLSDKEVENALKRAKNEQAIEQILERIRKKRSKS